MMYPGVEARGSKIRIAFHYLEQRCRETLSRSPTPANLKQTARLRSEILQKMGIDAFDYCHSISRNRNGAGLNWELRQQKPQLTAFRYPDFD